MTDYKIIQTINGPEDVKKLSMEQLEELASEIREALFNRLTKIGGHFGPNFGMVEAEIAMHYVFSSPKDKFIFDVSHQSYPHKILTGRKNGYISDEHFSEDSGYTNPEESEHDFFNVGHTSTSVSLATGLAKARDIKGDKENIIAIIKELARTKTIIMITHRLSTVTDCDEILVMQKGQLIERGKHQKLMLENGVYQKLFYQQKELEAYQG